MGKIGPRLRRKAPVLRRADARRGLLSATIEAIHARRAEESGRSVLIDLYRGADCYSEARVICMVLWQMANDMDFDYGSYDEEAAEMMTGIATGDVDREQLVDWIRANTTGGT